MFLWGSVYEYRNLLNHDDKLALEYGIQSDSCITVNFYHHDGNGVSGGPVKDNKVEHGC